MSALSPERSHDQNIKTLIVENPWAAITFALPKCVNVFRHEPEIEPIREETLKMLFSDSFLRMDVPLLVKYEKLAFTFLVEHQHDQYDFSIFQLARYVSYLQEQYEREVIPIVYFPNASSKNAIPPRATKSSFLGKRYFYFTYEAVFLKDMPAKKYLNSDNIIARLMLPFMRFSQQDWMEVLDSGVKAVLEMVDSAQGLRRNKYLDFLLFYFNLEEKEWETYRAYKQAQKKDKEIEMITTILKNQGKMEGRIEGRMEGKIEGKMEALLSLLPKKLGPMPPEIETSIRTLKDADRIDSLLNRFLEVRNWQEVKQLIN